MLRGLIVPLVTPLRADGSVCSESVATLIASLQAHASAVMPCLTTGEGWLLSDRQWADMVRYCLAHLGKERVIAGIEVPSTDGALMRAQAAANLGCDAIIATKPWGAKVSQEQIRAHYKALASSGLHQVFVYNEAWLSGNSIHPDTFLDLAKHPKISGIKESTGDLRISSWLLEHKNRLPPIFQGREELLQHSRHFAGYMVAAANLAPQLCVSAYDQPQPRSWDEVAALCNTHRLLTDHWIEEIKTELQRRGVIATKGCVFKPAAFPSTSAAGTTGEMHRPGV